MLGKQQNIPAGLTSPRVVNILSRFLPLLLFLLIIAPQTVDAQTQPDLPSYWQHSASGRLTHIYTADITQNGVDEVLIADENGKIELVGADGEPLWSYTPPGTALALQIINIDGPENAALEIIVGIPDTLIVLDVDGLEKWRTRLTPLTVPESLLTEGGLEAQEAWLDKYSFSPVSITSLDWNNDDTLEILVLLRSGQLLVYDMLGDLIWQYSQRTITNIESPSQLIVADFDQDGADEIALTIFGPRRFGTLIFIDEGQEKWDVPLSGRITALTAITFTDDAKQPLIAVGTSLGQIALYNDQRQRLWFRTLNVPITSLIPVATNSGQALAVGTAVGSVVVFDEDGRRLWANNLAENGDRSVLSLSSSAHVPPLNQPNLAAILESDANNSGAADIFLLNNVGLSLSKVADVDSRGLSQIVDTNDDNTNELLITRFATLSLLGLGVGNSNNVQEWEYALNAAPSAVLAIDFDGDSEEELVIGTQDGRLHSLSNERAIRWLHDIGGIITHLAPLPSPTGATPGIVVVRNEDSDLEPSGWIELREATGERLWTQQVDAPITALLVGNLDNRIQAEIAVGTSDGRILAYNAAGELLWEFALEALANGIQHLLILPRNNIHNTEVVAASNNRILALDPTTEEGALRNIAAYEAGIAKIYPVLQPGENELSISFLVLANDGSVHGLNWRGIEMAQLPWPQTLPTAPKKSLQAPIAQTDTFQNDRASFLIATEDGKLRQFDIEDNQPLIPWQLDGFGNITSLNWHDEDGDGRSDLVLIGNQDGQVWLYDQINSREPNAAITSLSLSSSVFALSTLNREASQMPDLLAVTENGLVQLYREQENRPPLLTNPTATAELGQYSISVAVSDIEQDPIAVGLEIFDPQTQTWLPQEIQQLSAGNGTLFWPIASPPNSPEGLIYRFSYDDGFYQGMMSPPPGPPTSPIAQLNSVIPLAVLSLLVVGILLFIFYVRQSQTTNARAQRFYRRLKMQPAAILQLLEHKYTQTIDSPDFLLSLANQARRENDQHIANLAEGLFLLTDRPQSGLSILNLTLQEMGVYEPHWHGLERWQLTYKTMQNLLEAPSITELTLLRPQLLQLLNVLETRNEWSPMLDTLRPILTNLRDSERVELVDDRLVYLSEAAQQIQRTMSQLPEYTLTIEWTVVQAILRRWGGLVSAAIEELRGQAKLIVKLKTKRLAPNRHTDVVLEITNSGRSAAENIIAILDADPAYKVYTPPYVIPFLPSGHTRQIRYTIEPQVIDRFRISLTLTYDDHNQKDKHIAFGDMVHILSPVRDFRPVVNLYMPGTPLRPGNLLFYGREDLFDFISENAGSREQRNALILVGQRRTGKTSALLRLGNHLPDYMLPVYIDCQSLGVAPGMPALLQEFAWYIADALALRGIEIAVPEVKEWQADAAFIFQRQFLPQVKALLPPDNTILLVFDEFEAFESLVNDGILPATFFTYLRHLMQHDDRLNFIFVGTRRLEEMSSNYWSVLFNIALYRKIGFLSEDAATRLITEPVAPNLVYDDLALDKILRVTAGHPYFLQLVCYTLVKQANSQRTGYITISDVNAAVDEMLSLGEVHFAYLWQRSTHTERALLTAVAHLMDRNTPFHPEELLQYLEPYDIHLGPAEVTAALNRLVERDIMHEVTIQVQTLYELKLGLVGQWVAQNKSLSKLYSSAPSPVESDQYQKV